MIARIDRQRADRLSGISKCLGLPEVLFLERGPRIRPGTALPFDRGSRKRQPVGFGRHLGDLVRRHGKFHLRHMGCDQADGDSVWFHPPILPDPEEFRDDFPPARDPEAFRPAAERYRDDPPQFEDHE